MHGTIHKWLFLPLLFALLIAHFPASAQGQVALDTVTVQLLPEFDQPSMLVNLKHSTCIYCFTANRTNLSTAGEC